MTASASTARARCADGRRRGRWPQPGTRHWPRRWPGTWQAACHPAHELTSGWPQPEPLSKYSAARWQQAIELAQAQPDAASLAGTDMPGLFLRAADALYLSGDSARVGVAEEACRRFADDPDPATAVVVRHRASPSSGRSMHPRAGLRLMEEALQLHGQAPPSFDHADALLIYANFILRYVEGLQVCVPC